MNYRREESWMGRSLQYYKPRITQHSIINWLFAKPQRAIAESVVAVERELFADVSFYQGIVNWLIMRTKARKVIIRAGQNTWVDIRFVSNYLLAKLAGFLRGVYWFYDGRASPGAQAALLVSFIQNDLPELGVWIDWERNYGGAHEGLRNVVAMMQEVERLLPGVEVGIYTGYYFFIENSNPILHRSQYAYLATKKLWLAFYALLSSVRIPSLWPRMTYWQKGTPSVGREWGVETIELDMNEVMEQADDPTPPPTGEPMTTLLGEVIATELNIRPIANTSLASIGKLIHFDLVEADAEFNGWWRLTSIKRGGQQIPLPGPVCYAYEGMTNGYIRDLSGSTPTPTERTVTKAVIHFSDGTLEEVFPPR